MKKIILAVALVLTLVLSIGVTLTACHKDKDDIDDTTEVTTTVYNARFMSEPVKLSLKSDGTCEISMSSTEGYESIDSKFEGTYMAVEGGYEVSATSGTYTETVWGLTENTVHVSSSIFGSRLKLRKIGDDFLVADSAYGLVFIREGVTASPSEKLTTFSNHRENTDFDYSFEVGTEINDENTFDYYIVYKDGTKVRASFTFGEMQTKFDSATIGAKSATDKDGNVFAYYVYQSLNDPEIDTLYLKSDASMIKVGTTLEDFIAAQPFYYYNTDTAAPVTAEMVTGFDASAAGNKIVNVKLNGYDVDLPLYVFGENEAKIVELSDIPAAVKKGTDLSGTLNIVFYDESLPDINAQMDDEKLTVTGYDKEAVGAQLVTFTYTDETMGTFTARKAIYVFNPGESPVQNISLDAVITYSEETKTYTLSENAAYVIHYFDAVGNPDRTIEGLTLNDFRKAGDAFYLDREFNGYTYTAYVTATTL